MAGLLMKVYPLYPLYPLKQSPTLEKGYTRIYMIRKGRAREQLQNSGYSGYKLLKPYNHRHLRPYPLSKIVDTRVDTVDTPC